MPLAARQQQLLEDLGIIPDRHERLTIIVERARHVPRFTPAERSQANAVRGCLSPVWVIGMQLENGTMEFRGDAESPLVKGFVALLCAFYSGAGPTAVAGTEPSFLDELGLIHDLSPTRRNGLASVRGRIRELALAATVPPGQPASP